VSIWRSPLSILKRFERCHFLNYGKMFRTNELVSFSFGMKILWSVSPRFLCRPTAFCSTCWSRGTSERSP
jgi:hypothetical protein